MANEQGHANGLAGAMVTSAPLAKVGLRAAEGRDVDASIMERVLIVGDLARLTPNERVSYYVAVCRSVGLNPLTKPFDYLQLNGKLTLYSLKNCTDQLRSIHRVSVLGLRRETVDGVHVATASVRDATGRTDEDIGAVSVKGLVGEAMANALMKATTKAKRRATLSICGLSFVDESELDSFPDAHRVTVDQDGVIVDGPGAGPVRPSPVPDLAVFAQICDAIDAAETAGHLNVIAHNSVKAHRQGLITEAHLEQIKVSVTKKRGLLGPMREVDPSGYDEGEADYEAEATGSDT